MEDTLRFEPNSIIKRSLYKEQLEHYYKYIPKERIKIVLFEDLIVDSQATIMDICDFLGIDGLKIDGKAFETHSNKTKNLEIYRATVEAKQVVSLLWGVSLLEFLTTCSKILKAYTISPSTFG